SPDIPESGPRRRVRARPCGTGAMSLRLRARFPAVELFGCDISQNQLLAARAEQQRVRDHFPLVRCNAAALPFSSSTFDAVHCSWLLEHVPREETIAILREVRRLLRPAGIAYLCEVENDSLLLWPRKPLL